MHSAASFSPSPQAQIYITSWKRPPKINTKSHKNLRFLFSSNSNTLFRPSFSSAPFPLNLKSTSYPIQLHPLADSVHDNLVENLENSMNSHIPINEIRQVTPLESCPRIFIQEPPWIASLFLKGLYKRSNQEVKLEFKEMEKRKYNLLRRRQIKAETEAWERMVEEYRELQREMCEKKLAPNLPYVKALFLGWFEPLRDAIEREQKVQRTKKQKAAFAPHIDLLPPDKMAVIVMHKMMGLFMMGNQEGYVLVVQAAVQIGVAIEQEVRIHSFLEKTKNYQRKKIEADTEEGLRKEKEILRKRVNSLIRTRRLKEVQKLLKNEEFEPWGRDTQAKLGSRLIELLTETAYVQPPLNQLADGPPDIRPAFRHKFKRVTNPGQKIVKKYGVIECDPLVLMGLDKTAKHMLIPYVPMLVPPKKWKGYGKGGHLFLPSYVMRTHGSRKQQDAVKIVPVKQMQKVFEALDVLGNTKWRVNRRVLNVVESIWARGGNVAGLVNREDVPIPEKPSSEDLAEIQEWKWNLRKAKKINLERHSQRCDTELKLSVAQKMRDEEGFYYPHNLDFRGRAYPMHPHLNHLSSDLCRGILEFAEGRPLGKSGLYWLKIHLANLYSGGVEKLSHDGRLAFVDNHLRDIFDSADNPINGNRWWLKAEDPFQFLAACINLSEALRSLSPHNIISHLPIHQDGSCNGLQHYAALGRDSMEAAAVNLTAGDKPADVYSEIAVRVHDIMKRDSNKDPATNPHALLAKILIDQVDRKLVKQTVMTSVYGVTYVGAREQIKRRLEEKGLITDDRLLFTAACYAAKVTLAALGEIFQAARDIMGWLGDCAKVIASENQPVRWTTPLGLPVVQPYCRSERHLIRTSLQVLALQREGNSVDVRKQRTAFPPNFVHSLDGTHMMMTAIACRDAGLRFAGVHDSFWTHACDVEKILLQVIDDWRDIALPKEHTRAPRVRTLGVNSLVTGFGNEFQALGSNGAHLHPGLGSGSSVTEAVVQNNMSKSRSSNWWFDEDGLFNLDEEGRAEKQQCAVAASNIIRNFSFMPENELIMAQHRHCFETVFQCIEDHITEDEELVTNALETIVNLAPLLDLRIFSSSKPSYIKITEKRAVQAIMGVLGSAVKAWHCAAAELLGRLIINPDNEPFLLPFVPQIHRRLVDLMSLPALDAQAAAVGALYNLAEVNMDCRLKLASERWAIDRLLKVIKTPHPVPEICRKAAMILESLVSEPQNRTLLLAYENAFAEILFSEGRYSDTFARILYELTSRPNNKVATARGVWGM